MLKDANLHTVAKQRRKEAMDFVTNFKVIEDNKLIGKFASMKELLKAVDTIVNPKVEKEPKVPVEPEAPVLAIEDKSSEAVAQSTKTVEDLALDVLLQVEANGFKVSDFKIAIANAIGMLEENNEVVPFEMVG